MDRPGGADVGCRGDARRMARERIESRPARRADGGDAHQPGYFSQLHGGRAGLSRTHSRGARRALRWRARRESPLAADAAAAQVPAGAPVTRPADASSTSLDGAWRGYFIA